MTQILWQAYRDKIYQGAVLDAEQERECSLAYYAGMMDCFEVVSGTSDKCRDEEQGAEMLETFRQELIQAAEQAAKRR